MTYTIKEKVEHLSKTIYDFVCDYRKYNDWYFYDKEIKDLDSVVRQFDNEDIGLDLMTDLSGMFYHFATSMNFENKKEEEFFDTLCSIFKEYNSFINLYNKEYKINSFANSLIKYVKDVNPYEYNDIYDSDDQAFEDMKKNLSTASGVETIIKNICNDINHFTSESDLSNKDVFNHFQTANELLIKLNDYSKKLEIEDSKEMDM